MKNLCHDNHIFTTFPSKVSNLFRLGLVLWWITITDFTLQGKYDDMSLPHVYLAAQGILIFELTVLVSENTFWISQSQDQVGKYMSDQQTNLRHLPTWKENQMHTRICSFNLSFMQICTSSLEVHFEPYMCFEVDAAADLENVDASATFDYSRHIFQNTDTYYLTELPISYLTYRSTTQSSGTPIQQIDGKILFLRTTWIRTKLADYTQK